MMITPLTKAINRRNEWIVGGCNSEGKKRVRKKRERERKELTLRKREKSVCIRSLNLGQPKVGYSDPPNK